MRRGTVVGALCAVAILLSGCSPATSRAPGPATVSPTPVSITSAPPTNASLATTAAPESKLVLPPRPRAYFFGDSWTAGKSASTRRSYVYVTSTTLGWLPTVDAVGGTGYSHVFLPGTKPYPERVAAIAPTAAADVVILQGGLNDEPADLNALPAAAQATVVGLEKRFPRVPIIIIGPAPPKPPASPALVRVDAVLRQTAQRNRLYYISPIEENWLTPQNAALFIDRATDHPSTEGHAYYGARVVADILAFEGR